MTLGLGLGGCEEQFERAIRERAKDGQPFVYVEIGVFECGTFASVCQLLRETNADWRATAIDPSEVSRKAYMTNVPNKRNTMFLNGTREEAFTFAKELIGDQLNFVMIDGCHSELCATEDFLAVEPLVIPGGLVVMHDHWDGPAGINEHCNAELGVIPAVKKLGLFDDSRPGWKRLPDWETDMTTINRPCGCYLKL